MKIIKLNKSEQKIDRQLITSFGDAIYNKDGVESIEIKINFKDGSNIGYKRHEIKDRIDKEMEEEDEEEE